MARVRIATDAVSKVGKTAIKRALQASLDAKTMKNFYKIVDMRNPSRSYFVRFEGRLHSLKAVVTKALREEMPEISARDFHAADAAKRLSKLEFDVEHNDGDAEYERQRIWIERLARSGQLKFRNDLIDIYGKCAFSSCSTVRALEAAHVDPVKKNGIDDPSNGILLRADLHRLFDADLIAIHPKSGRLHVAEQCNDDYRELLCDITFSPPLGGPTLCSFEVRWKDFEKIKDSR